MRSVGGFGTISGPEKTSPLAKSAESSSAATTKTGMAAGSGSSGDQSAHGSSTTSGRGSSTGELWLGGGRGPGSVSSSDSGSSGWDRVASSGDLLHRTHARPTQLPVAVVAATHDSSGSAMAEDRHDDEDVGKRTKAHKHPSSAPAPAPASSLSKTRVTGRRNDVLSADGMAALPSSSSSSSSSSITAATLTGRKRSTATAGIGAAPAAAIVPAPAPSRVPARPPATTTRRGGSSSRRKAYELEDEEAAATSDSDSDALEADAAYAEELEACKPAKGNARRSKATFAPTTATGKSKLDTAAPSAKVDKLDKVAMRREWNRLNARKSRERKRFMMEALGDRVARLSSDARGLHAMLSEAGLADEWRAFCGKGKGSGTAAPTSAPPSVAVSAGAGTAAGGRGKGKGKATGGAGAAAGDSTDSPAMALAIKTAITHVPRDASQTQAGPEGVSAAPTAHHASASAATTGAGVGAGAASAAEAAAMSNSQAELSGSDFALVECVARCKRHFIITDPRLPDNPIVFASQGFYELTGYTPDQTLGRNCRFLQGDDTDPRPVALMRSRVAAGSDVSVLLRNYRRDGTPFWNEVFVAPLRGPDGSVAYFVGVQSDVPEAVVPARLKEQEAQLLAAGLADKGKGTDTNSMVRPSDRGMSHHDAHDAHDAGSFKMSRLGTQAEAESRSESESEDSELSTMKSASTPAPATAPVAPTAHTQAAPVGEC